jgi:hypothetical protein
VSCPRMGSCWRSRGSQPRMAYATRGPIEPRASPARALLSRTLPGRGNGLTRPQPGLSKVRTPSLTTHDGDGEVRFHGALDLGLIWPTVRIGTSRSREL